MALLVASACVPGSGQMIAADRRGKLFIALWALPLVTWTLWLPHLLWSMVAAQLVVYVLALLSCNATFKALDSRLHPVARLFACAFLANAAVACFGLTVLGRGYRTYTVPSSSMSPTLPVGATIMVNTHAYHSALPQRGDIVAYEDDERIWHTKRAIALPGDSLLMTEKQVIVNGAPRQEPYAIYIGFGSADAPREFGPTTVPAQGIFVLGDNRDYSLDSRCQQLGPIPLSQLRGKVVDVVTLRRTRRG